VRRRVVKTDLVPVGTPIDLENCDREPIHIPGSIQPHGALLVLDQSDNMIVQVSENAYQILGLEVFELLGHPLARVLSDIATSQVSSAQTDAGHGAPLTLETRAGALLDGLVHESGGLRILEVEPTSEGVTLANTYHAVRQSVTLLNRSDSVDGVKRVAVEEFRRLTGFDRVMYYLFDRDWNGEVVAEDRRADLEPFLGLHYPASDIPAQARALYARNWLRFIGDRTASPASLVPIYVPLTGKPLDLSFSVLRSVSPIHLQYLANMGVTASMSVSVLDGADLIGLIACHHYSGPLVPPAPVRATCEFLAQTVSMLLASRRRERAIKRTAESEGLIQQIRTAIVATSSILDALRAEAPSMLQLTGAAGIAVSIDGTSFTQGAVPDPDTLARIVDLTQALASEGALFATDSLAKLDPELEAVARVASGVLALFLDGQGYVLVFRPELVEEVHWGGDPREKPVRVGDDGVSRLSPRGSFALWKETVRGRSRPWDTGGEVMGAAHVRREIMGSLFRQARSRAAVAEALQESLLPSTLPSTPGWLIESRYQPASIGVGGDWYDVMPLAGGRVACVVGDISGHGLAAAGRMSQMRNVLRAYLFHDGTAAGALALLDRYAEATDAPEGICTVALAILAPDGTIDLTLAGHPPPLIRTTRGNVRQLADGRNSLLGVGLLDGAEVLEAHEQFEPGDVLIMFSDGLIERRGESIDAGYGRLEKLLADGAPNMTTLLDQILDATTTTNDDVTLLAIERAPE
jgi:two-component system, chemotaxis family, sensor kinase Cph1